MTPKRVMLAGLCGALVAAGVVFAIVNLSAADQVASVASFVLAAILAGMAVADRRADRHVDRPGDPPAAAPSNPTPGAPGAPAAGDQAVIVGPGGRAAINSGVVFNDKANAKVTINHGTKQRWWRRRGASGRLG
ncbi:hypothetical protein AB0J80_29135 [Actinoplanes sp. NPDC049548]|uniref:hypothetical protein n=1 Tax=Actinoplanes sp. NPDC049548 TaxID=3155152 RepID=UPI003437E528